MISIWCSGQILYAQVDDFYEDGEYRRAVDDKDNVKDKLFTKKGRVELNLPDLGMVLNTAFVDTYLVHGGITYYRSEEWGFGLEGSMGLNRDRDERECLENFYNDPKNKITARNAVAVVNWITAPLNYGPAYMPIREMKYIIAGNAVWNPLYGKQLLMLSATSYFVFFCHDGRRCGDV